VYNDRHVTKVSSGELNRDSTDSKKAELALAISEEKFRAYVELSPVAVFVVNSDGKYEYVNEAASKMLGYSIEELLRMNLSQLLFKEDIPSGLKKFGELQQTGRSLSDITLKTKDGLPVYVILNSVKIPDGKLLAFCENVTERKKTEAALSVSEAKLRSIVENSNDQIFMIDRTHKYLFVNKVLAEVIGKSPEDIIGKSIFEVYPPETADQFSTNTQNVFATGKSMFVEEKMVVNDQDLCINTGLNPVLDAERNVISVTGIVRDITENKKTEALLRDSEEKYRTIVEQSALGILIAQGPIPHIVYANSTISKSLGYSVQELISLSLQQTMGLVHPDDRELFFGRLKDRLEGKPTSEQYIIRGIRKDRSIVWIELSSALIMYDGHPAVQAMFVDINERKKAEEKLVDSYRALEKQLSEINLLQKELETANKLLGQSNVDLENYTYVVSHDLKAPLRAIRSFSTFIIEDFSEKLDDTGKDYFQRIVDASSRMDTLIENLLLLSRVGRKFMEVETVDLNQLLEEIVADLTPTLKKNNGKIVFHNLPKVSIPRTWMKQIFMNLIDNGLKFNKSKTPTVEVTCEETEPELLFKVSDNGIGVEEKYFDRLFNLFERLHTQEEYSGTGAGLAICKKIIQQFGGRIWIESQVSKGSTFFFTLSKKKNPTLGGN
jgi:PAS domain S-box-containing protein